MGRLSMVWQVAQARLRIQRVAQAALRNCARAGCAPTAVAVLAMAPALTGEGAGVRGRVGGAEGLKGLYLSRWCELTLTFCHWYSYIKVAVKAIKISILQ